MLSLEWYQSIFDILSMASSGKSSESNRGVAANNSKAQNCVEDNQEMPRQETCYVNQDSNRLHDQDSLSTFDLFAQGVYVVPSTNVVASVKPDEDN